MPDIQIEGRELGDNPYAPQGVIAYHQIQMEREKKAQQSDKSEAEFQAEIIAYALSFGWLVYHTYNSRGSQPGFPDLVLCHDRWGLIFAEVKTPKGHLTREQVVWLKALDRQNQYAMVWRPSDWLKIRLILEGSLAPTDFHLEPHPQNQPSR